MAEGDGVLVAGQDGPVLALDGHRLLQRVDGVLARPPGQLRPHDLLYPLAHQRPDALLGAVRQHRQVVAALQDQADLALADGAQLAGEEGETGSGHQKFGPGI